MKATEAVVLPLGGFSKFGTTLGGGARAGAERFAGGVARSILSVTPKPVWSWLLRGRAISLVWRTDVGETRKHEDRTEPKDEEPPHS